MYFVWFRFLCPRTCLHSIRPSTSGIIKSPITQSGFLRAMSSITLELSVLVVTEYPASFKKAAISFRTTGSSSTM